MKDIFAIQCPITERIVAISKRPYGQIPPRVRKNKKFWEWVSKLEKDGLQPVYKILDKVNKEDLEIMYEMYLGLFGSWNISLYNNIPIQETLGLHSYICRESHNKYLLNDLGRMKSCLELFYRFIKSKSLIPIERTMFQELILICWLKCHCDPKIKTRDLSGESLSSLLKKVNKIPEFVSECFNGLLARKKSLKSTNEFFFSEINNLDESGVINGINFIFLKCEMRLIISELIWNNFYNIYSFLNNSKIINHRYEIATLYSELELDIESHLTHLEYEKLASCIPKSRSIFSQLIYCDITY